MNSWRVGAPAEDVGGVVAEARARHDARVSQRPHLVRTPLQLGAHSNLLVWVEVTS